MVRRRAFVIALALSACSRGDDRRAPAPGPSAAEAAGSAAPSAAEVIGSAAPSAAAPSLDEPAASGSAPSFGAPPLPAEARRSALARLADDRALAAHEAVIRAHFAGAVPEPLEVQSAALGGDRRAVLLSGPPRQRSPILLVLDRDNALLWTKDRPLAGTRQVVTEMVIAPGPRGEVALMWCDIPTQVVALRKWAWDGTVLADFQVAEVDVCDALAGLYWPSRGWIAVASQHGAARAQLLDEHGQRAFGPHGVDLPWRARPSAPAAIAVDSDASAMFFQVGDRVSDAGGTIPDHLLAARLDREGAQLWPRPLDLGAVPAASASARIATAARKPGMIHVTLGKSISANVTSAGSIPAR